jgi:hypothetical protein
MDRRRISFLLYIGSYIVGLGLLAVLLGWPPVLLLLWSGVGWSGCDGSSGGAGESAAISFGEALWGIKEGLVGFASRRAFLLSLPRLRWWQFWCLRRAWEVCLPTCAAGLVLDPTSFGGLLPLLGVLASGEMGVLAPTLWCQISISSSEVMATGHLQQPGRSVVYGMPMYSTYYSCWQWKTMMSRR